MELPILTKLRDELKDVERELRVDVPRELRTAAAHGDLRENSEYEAAKHRQSFLQARAGQLSQRINSLSSLNPDDIPRDVIGFGSKVYLEDMASGDEVVYELVTPEEVDPKIGKISVGSPIGRALLNKEEGDDITIILPSGTKEYGVTRLETIHELLLKE
ncbi:Transcription elongation factor GreA [hydrothermal vent metagenome]|uniref:Transcription elongation factor GreA n=1 Tax=hydrothermal vent metagenome TaxID=652676 RepID=A0A3B0QKD8_9ZZZZ